MHWARLEASALGSLIAACPAWKRREWVSPLFVVVSLGFSKYGVKRFFGQLVFGVHRRLCWKQDPLMSRTAMHILFAVQTVVGSCATSYNGPCKWWSHQSGSDRPDIYWELRFFHTLPATATVVYFNLWWDPHLAAYCRESAKKFRYPIPAFKIVLVQRTSSI